MDLPLISHPNASDSDHNRPTKHISSDGHLLLTAHNNAVADRASRLYGDASDEEQTTVQTAAVLHDLGKATPQFQSHVRPTATYDGPDAEKAHARIGALAAWYVLGQQDVSDRNRLAATLAVARHHQALPNAAQYTAEPLARAFETGETAVQAQVAGISDQWPEAATQLLRQAPGTDIEWAVFAEWARSGAAAEEIRAVSAKDILGGIQPDSSALPSQLYDRLLHYWSAITLADKTHAMDIPASHLFDLDTLEQTAVERYVASLQSTSSENDHMAALNGERERARQQAIRGVHEWLDNRSTVPSIATLTLPTGLGKTLTGLSAAFETRDLLAAQRPQRGDRPIIYALPYTSIIEQTRALFEDPDLWGADPQASALTVHHYLSETVVQRDDHNQEDVDTTDAEAVATLLGESWRDGTVLTTFVQLFESLTGPSNRQGLKLPALESGLIILDEPQALPKDWWDGIKRLLKLLTEEYGARVIAMTATQPTLVQNLESVSLLEAGRKRDREGCQFCDGRWADGLTLQPAPRSNYYAEAERVRYHIHESALAHDPGGKNGYVGHDTAAERLLETAETSGSTLAVCNTIGSSRALTDLVASRPNVVHLGEKMAAALTELGADATTTSVDPSTVADHILQALPLSSGSTATPIMSSSGGVDVSEILLLTLNSRYRPFDRRVIIALADRLSTSDHSFVLVSTQAIEAGVDLSFQTVFRDIAPLDSIVQAAGRCNRSYEWGRNGGEVTVWTLADPDEETPATPTSPPPAHYVYERGATESGLPGHLRMISEVLADIGIMDDIADEVFSQSAVKQYFDALEDKSLSAGDLRESIEDAKGQWLAQQSLIGGRETVDVLVAQTDSERAAIDQLTERLSAGDPTAYDDLQATSGLRVSVPIDVIESAPSVSRLDGKKRDDDGVNVFRYTGGGGLQYDLTDGGLQPNDGIESRFTI